MSRIMWLFNAGVGHLLFEDSPEAELKFELVFNFVQLQL
jgi:hypothetical protein